MKKTLTFEKPVIASSASKINVDFWDKSKDAFDEGKYMESINFLFNYINEDIRVKYGENNGTEFNIPHGSIIVNVKIEENKVKVSAPFMALPEKGKIPMMRQITSLNFNDMDLTQIYLRNNELTFEYSCDLDLVNPYKMYYVFKEICYTGDKYDDEFETKFGAKRIYEPKVTPYDKALVEKVCQVIQNSCDECFEGLKKFEGERQYGFAWNIIATTMYKIMYVAHPQGQLLNDINKAVREHDREDIPLPEIVSIGKRFISKIKEMSKEEIVADLYYVDTFISPKYRSNLSNIQDNFKNSYEKAEVALDREDYLTCCMLVVYKFYEMYYYNDVQEDVNRVVMKAMEEASAKPWEEAAPVLFRAMNRIMQDELEVQYDAEEGKNDEQIDYSGMMGNIQQMQQQMMQNVDIKQLQQMQQQMMQNYMQNLQNMMGGAVTPEEDNE